MANITIIDLDTDIELDNEALIRIAGGRFRNPMQVARRMSRQINRRLRTTHSPQAVARAYLRYANRLRRSGFAGFIPAPRSNFTQMRILGFF